MKVGSYKESPIYNGGNYNEIINSLPFYITRDDQSKMKKGKPHICSGECPISKEVHFFTNIGILNLKIGETLKYMDAE